MKKWDNCYQYLQEETMSDKKIGPIKWFNEKKGFGFIETSPDIWYRKRVTPQVAAASNLPKEREEEVNLEFNLPKK